MEKEKFEIIHSELMKRAEWCNKYLGPITSKQALLSLSMQDYLELVKGCKKLHSDSDKIHAECIHIIGMGNLTAVQQSRLIAALKQFDAYRGDIKALSMNGSLDNVPGVPSGSEYTLTVLGNFKLTAAPRGSNGINTIEDVTNSKKPKKITPGTYCAYVNPETKDKLKIEFSVTDSDTAAQIREGFNMSMGSNKLGKKFTKKMLAGGLSNGIMWSVANGTSRCVLEKNCQHHLIFFEHFEKLLQK